MEPFTIAGIVTIVLTGALTKLGESTLEGSLEQLSKLIQQRSPNAWKKIVGVVDNQQVLPEAIKVMVEVIAEDQNIKEIAGKIAEENKSKPEIINNMKNVGMIVQGGTIQNPTFHFN